MATPEASELERRLSAFQERISGIRLEIPELEPLREPAPAPRPPQDEAPAPAPPKALDAVTLPQALSARRGAVGRLPVPLWVWAAAAVLTGAAIWVRAGLWPWVNHRAVDLPFTQATGLALQGNRLVIADKKRQLLFTFSADRMQVQSVKRFPNPSVGGLAWGNGALWSSQPDAGRIFQHGPDQEHPVARTFENSERRAGSLYWDGDVLWASDPQTEMIYQFAPQSAGKVVKQFYLPGRAVGGIHVSGGRLWVLDSITQSVYRYRLDSGTTLSPEATVSLGRWLPPYCLLTGFALQGGSVWLVSDNPSQLHRFRLRGLHP